MKFFNWLDKHNKIILYCSITAIITFLLSCFYLGSNIGFDQLYLRHIIEKYYVEDVDREIISNGAVSGMLDSLGDEHTMYISSDYGFDKFDLEITGEYTGIGITISGTDEGVVIDKVFNNSPAENSGLKVGDILIKINDTNVEKMSSTGISELIIGTTDKSIDITVKRNNEIKEIKGVEKGEIEAPSVEYKTLDNNLGYMWITSFDADTNVEVENAVKDMKDIQGLIIDVRDNPGGLLNVVLETLDLFLDEGPALKVKYKGSSKEDYNSVDGKIFDKSIVILTNENSASAAEIFASAMSERNAAITVGKKTYGKGTVQRVFRLPGNAGANITVAKFYSPNGNAINKNGVTPQFEIDNPEIYKDIFIDEIPAGKDAQLNYAINLILNN